MINFKQKELIYKLKRKLLEEIKFDIGIFVGFI